MSSVMQSLQIEKKELRRQLLQIRRDIPTEQKNSASLSIRSEILKLIDSGSFDAVLLFSPIRGEPDVASLTEELIKRSIRVAFPISLTEVTQLDFREVYSLDDLKAGAYGISEPDASAPHLGSLKNTLCVVPAIAYDKSGIRLGYGKGYYDRFLSAVNVTAVGVCYSCLLMDTLPCDPNDIPVDIIITERGTFALNEAYHFTSEQNSTNGKERPFKKA